MGNTVYYINRDECYDHISSLASARPCWLSGCLRKYPGDAGRFLAPRIQEMRIMEDEVIQLGDRGIQLESE